MNEAAVRVYKRVRGGLTEPTVCKDASTTMPNRPAGKRRSRTHHARPLDARGRHRDELQAGGFVRRALQELLRGHAVHERVGFERGGAKELGDGRRRLGGDDAGGAGRTDEEGQPQMRRARLVTALDEEGGVLAGVGERGTQGSWPRSNDVSQKAYTSDAVYFTGIYT